MKKLLHAVSIAAFIISFSSCASSSRAVDETYYNKDGQPEETVTYETFYNELSPYGRWIDYPGYGNVWAPSIAGFRPYYDNGYWVNTSFGWSWNSNYNWGWAPFHYGRWFSDPSLGWLWVPGYEWAPAWVNWRSNAGYYGWAPVGPGLAIGVSVGIPTNHWVFVENRYLATHNFNNYVVNVNRNQEIINNTSIINNYNYTKNKSVYNSGPQVTEVEKYTGHKITTVPVQQHPANTTTFNKNHPLNNRNHIQEIQQNKNIEKREPPVKQMKVEKVQHKSHVAAFVHQNEHAANFSRPAYHAFSNTGYEKQIRKERGGGRKK